jgi:hypothetical protein
VTCPAQLSWGLPGITWNPGYDLKFTWENHLEPGITWNQKKSNQKNKNEMVIVEVRFRSFLFL